MIYNKDQVIDPSDGEVWGAVSQGHIKKSDFINVDLIRPTESFDILGSEDPFNSQLNKRSNQENTEH